MIKTNKRINEMVKESLKFRGDNVSLYALQRIEEIEQALISKMETTYKLNKMYIVSYSAGNHGDHHEVTLFVTSNKSTATKYVTKFNKILKKWKQHYKKYEQKCFGNIFWLKDEYVEQHFDRWDSLKNINNCYFKEIEVR